MRLLTKVNAFLNRILVGIGGGILVFMILLTCANVFLRMVWVPLKGTFELMGYLAAVMIAFSLGYTQTRNGHISVDILVCRFSDKTRRFLNAFNGFICMVFFVIAGMRIAQYASSLMKSGEVTETLRIAYYPFTYAVSFGFVVLSLVCLVDCLKALLPERD